MKLIGTCGTPQTEYVISTVRSERRGYFTILSYAVKGLKHWMEMAFRRDGQNRPYQTAAFLLPVDFINREVYLIRAPRHNRFFVRTDEGMRALAKVLSDGGAPGPFVVPADLIDNWDTAAGMVESGEKPAPAAIREGMEELGINMEETRLIHVASMNGSIGALGENLEGYIYPIDDRIETVAPKGDGDENHTVWRLSFEEAFDLLDQGQLQNAGGRTLVAHLKRMDLEQRLLDATRKNDELRIENERIRETSE